MIKKGITFVIALLRAQVIEVMDELTLKEEAILRIITDRKLLTRHRRVMHRTTVAGEGPTAIDGKPL